jgi:hypothetical protein
MNATLVNMVDWSDPERTLKPLVDGGTEGTFLNARKTNSFQRISWPSSSNHSHTVLLLRMFSGYARQAHSVPCMYYRHYTPTS